jgi:hypothetical protein
MLNDLSFRLHALSPRKAPELTNHRSLDGTPVIQGSCGYLTNPDLQPITWFIGCYIFIDSNSSMCLNVHGGANRNVLQ